jgi:CheY-specific phosphatase CheX
MRESLESILVGATQRALETTAFLFAEPGAPDATDGDASTADAAGCDRASVAATVTFTGSHNGALCIEFPVRLLPVLAANVLGEEDAPDEATQHDALGELANIVCGNVLPELNPDGKYSLGPPAVGAVAAVVPGDAARVASGDMQVEGGKVATSLWLCAPGTTARPA